MFFRFAAALILVVLVSMVGIGLEKQAMQMKRAISRQYFQKDLLLEMHATLRLSIQRVTAPSRFPDAHDGPSASVAVTPYQPTQLTDSGPNRTPSSSSLPLLRWEHPAETPH